MRHPATGLWWQYDDERVVSLGANPLGDATSAAGGAAKGATPAKAAPKATASKARAGRGGDDDDDVVLVEDTAPAKPRGRGAQPPPPPAAAAAASSVPEGHLASSDAYLLLYTRRPGPGQAPPPEPPLPEDLARAIAAENEAATAGARARETAEREVRQRVTARQTEVRSVLAAAEPQAGQDADVRWVSAEWLANWSSAEYAPQLLCFS